MALVNSSFTVNVTPGAMPPIVHVSEYDIGRTYTVTINGQNGSAFNIPTGTTATVEGTLNGVIGFTTGATISGSNVSFTLTESMTAKSGKAWCKIKLTLNDEPIQTCAFVLSVDRAGLEAETVIGASGFEQQIVDAVQDWLGEHPPAVGGMSEAFKQALLDCFENVAWINEDGQDYYDALYAALYPPVDVLSISAVFTQGDNVIYDTDSLDDLKQYLVVTATMTDSTTQTLEDTDYTLSGTLTEGTSTITVSYGGKTTTFNVTVTQEELMLNDILTLDGIKNTRNGHDASATTWEDLSGNNNDFAQKSGASAVSWGADHAIFDATNRVLVNSENLFTGKTSATIEIVFSISGDGSTQESGTYFGSIFTTSNNPADSATKGFRCNSYNALGVSSYYNGTNTGYSGGSSQTFNNVVRYVAFVFTASECKRYVDGELKATVPVSFPGNTFATNAIGGFFGSAEWFANANIYRLSVDSSAMTATEISERYAFYRTRFGMS